MINIANFSMSPTSDALYTSHELDHRFSLKRSTQPNTTSGADNSSEMESHDMGGAVAGAVVGAVLGPLLLALIIVLVLRQRRRHPRQDLKRPPISSNEKMKPYQGPKPELSIYRIGTRSHSPFALSLPIREPQPAHVKNSESNSGSSSISLPIQGTRSQKSISLHERQKLIDQEQLARFFKGPARLQHEKNPD